MSSLRHLSLFLLLSVSCITLHGQGKFSLNHFRGEIESIYPVRFASSSVPYGYYLELRNDSVFVDMPYMGEVFMPSLHSDGLTFAHHYKTDRIKTNKKKTRLYITFHTQHYNIVYLFRLTIYCDNTFYLTVVPSNAQACSYTGCWESPGDE